MGFTLLATLVSYSRQTRSVENLLTETIQEGREISTSCEYLSQQTSEFMKRNTSCDYLGRNTSNEYLNRTTSNEYLFRKTPYIVINSPTVDEHYQRPGDTSFFFGRRHPSFHNLHKVGIKRVLIVSLKFCEDIYQW